MAPTLLIVGGRDQVVHRAEPAAQAVIPKCQLTVVPGATHLFEEPGAGTGCQAGVRWFIDHLCGRPKRLNRRPG